ncbi:MAG: GMC family oxidoreductase [Elusimicrobia bacterium]|nr:GMC family oxidoreductase [Elusimicrobiota bacterium]
MRVDGSKASAFDEAFDYVIVGSGAAGATAARVLADTGRSVAVLEEGPAVDPKEFSTEVFPSFQRMFRGQGGQVARGRAFIPVVQGRCLGGSTVINSAIVWRLPDDVWEPWKTEYGLGDALPLSELHKHWDLIEKELSIAETPPQVWGEFNRLMDVAKTNLRVSAAPIRRNVRDCRASARCLTGCPTSAKQSMLVTYLPYAEKKGAALLTCAKAEEIRWDGDRATAVSGTFEAPGRPRFTARARKAVLVAASAIQTPGLLARSGVDSPHLGEHFQAHPGCALMGIFPNKVGMWRGATQGYDADHHRRLGRFKIETIALPPEIVFARLPGAGKRWMRAMLETPYAAIWAVQMRAWAQGSVRERFFGTDIKFDLTPRDLVQMRRGLRFTAELFFAAGAKEVWPGIHGLPERIKPGEEWLLETAPADSRAYSMILSHLFGTARMSVRAADGVVGTDFAVHATRNLFVVDSSLFPTNTSVNPQHTIMGVAMHAANRISEAKL